MRGTHSVWRAVGLLFWAVSFLAIAGVAFFPSACRAAVVKSSVTPSATQRGSGGNGLTYLSKFCYDTTGLGSMSLVVSSESKIPSGGWPKLALYYDVDGSWPTVYKTDMSCADKLKAAKLVRDVSAGGNISVEFKDVERPHFWYFAAVSCAPGDVDFTLDYELTMLQSSSAAEINRQFSFDQQGLPETYISFFVGFVLLLLVSAYSAVVLARKKSLHPIMQLIYGCVFLATFGVFLKMLHFGAYAEDGIGLPVVLAIGEVFDMCATVLFIIVLLLIARGWGITYPTLQYLQAQRIALLITLVTFVTAYAVLFCVQMFALDPATTLFVYASVPGWILNGVRFLVLVYFVWALQGTFVADPDRSKKLFYLIFGGVFGLWFLSLPILTLLSLAFAPWDEQKIVVSIYLVIEFAAFVTMVVLLLPSRAAKYFSVAVPDLLSSEQGAGYDRL